MRNAIITRLTATLAPLLVPLALGACTRSRAVAVTDSVASGEVRDTKAEAAPSVLASREDVGRTSSPKDAPAPLASAAGAPAGFKAADDEVTASPALAPLMPAAPPAEPAYDRRVAALSGSAPPSSSPPAAHKPSATDGFGRGAGDLGGLALRGGAGGGPAATAAPSTPFFNATPAASISAGEWNDNANYHEFTKWLATETNLPFRHVDVSHRRFLVVRDENGRAVPGCRVEVSDAQERRVAFTTGPSGRALLFPRAEGIGDGLTTATATCQGASVTRPVPLGDSDGVVDLQLPVERHLSQDRTIDVAFILDTTGSMSEEIASVKATIAKVAAGLGEGNVAVRIGLVEFKDRGDAFVTRVYPFATDVKAFSSRVAGITAGGGGDTPESVNEGIHVALNGLDWHQGSVGRFAFLVGDAPPHLDYQQDFSYAADMKTAAHRGIQIFTIAASGMDGVGQVVWRQIAQYTNAANMFVLRGGAGPQSVGGGDPRSSCGGTHESYTSGHLDALILGKINGELRALEGDPMRIAGLGEDENVKPCDQRVGMR